MGAIVRSGAAADRTVGRSRRAWLGRLLAIGIAGLIQAILILGFVAASLGIGVDGTPDHGPDRPQPPDAVVHTVAR